MRETQMRSDVTDSALPVLSRTVCLSESQGALVSAEVSVQERSRETGAGRSQIPEETITPRICAENFFFTF